MNTLDMDTEAARIREVVRQWAEAIKLRQAIEGEERERGSYGKS